MARARPARFKFTWLQIVTHLGALAPLAVMIWDGYHHGLTYNPIQSLTFRTGKTALVLLVLSLACTPLNSVFGFREAIKLRRPLGVYAFLYALGHFCIFLFDYTFDPQMIFDAVFMKRYALVGFAAFLLLLPLALTSTRGWQKRLGKNWRRLHNLVYVAACLVIIHFVWLVKADIRQPLAFGFVVAALLALRLSPVKRAARMLAERAEFSRRPPAPKRPSPIPSEVRAPSSDR
jgi:sulfoxide reductase heme-binding subunit YedZ